MNLPLTIAFCALLLVPIGVGARLCVESDPLDVLLLALSCVGIGYMLPLLA